MKVGDIYSTRNGYFIVEEMYQGDSIKIIWADLKWRYNSSLRKALKTAVQKNCTKVGELVPRNKLSEKVYPKSIKVRLNGINYLLEKNLYEKFYKLF